jgi:hypothetical protein
MRFKVGDKVIPLPYSDSMDTTELIYVEDMDTYAGKIGTIVQIHPEGWLSVLFDCGRGEYGLDTWSYLQDWVRLAASLPNNEIEEILDFYGDNNV